LSDDEDIKHEIHCIFVRTNILLYQFSKCSVSVKSIQLTAYCLYVYDIGLWRHETVSV